MVLIVNKVNKMFVETTKSSQKSGLSVSLSFIQHYFQGSVKLVEVVNYDEAWSHILMHKPMAIIFESNQFQIAAMYQTRLKLEKLGHKCDIFFHTHSKYPFLTHEGHYISYVQEANKLGICSIFNNVDSFKCFNNSTNLYLPNLYHAEKPAIAYQKNESELHIGCHGSLRPMKNQIMQAFVALKVAKDLGKKLVFHINGTRDDGGGIHILTSLVNIFNANPYHELRLSKWFDHKEFLNECTKLDLGMQLSVSESFNTVTADYITAEIPVIVSQEISWVSPLSLCHATNFDYAVARCKDLILNKEDVIKANKIALKVHNDVAFDEWAKFINNYI